MFQLPRHLVRSVGAGFLALLVFAPPGAASQNPPLAEVARREAERRKATKGAARVLTNQDLPPVSARGSVAAEEPAPPATDSADKNAADKTVADKGAADKAATQAPAAGDAVEKGETWWRLRIAEPRDTVRRNQILFDALQARVNGLTAEVAVREPYQRAGIDEDRQKAFLELERVRTEIGAAKKAIEDIEEEARKAGVPPGWLR